MNKWWFGALLGLVSFGSPLKGQDLGFVNVRSVTERGAVLQADSWSDVAALLATPATDTTPTQIGRVAAKAIIYRLFGNGEFFDPMLLAEPTSRMTFVVRAHQSFYVLDDGDIVGCYVGEGTISLIRSYARRGGLGAEDTAIADFLASHEDSDLEGLRRRSTTFISVRAGLPLDFFDSLPKGSSGAAAPSIETIDVRNRVLRLDLRSPHGYTAQVRIDLKDQRLLSDQATGVPVLPASPVPPA